MRPAFGDLVHRRHRNSGSLQHKFGARSGDQFETQRHQIARGIDDLRLVTVLHGNEHAARLRQHGGRRKLALGKGRGEIGINAHHFAGGLHFGAEHRINTGEAREREHGFLHGDMIADIARGQIEAGKLFTRHHPRGDLGHRDAGRLGGERHGAAGARVDLDQVNVAILDGELHVHQALHLQGAGQYVGLALDLGDDVVGQAVGRQRTRRVPRVHTGFLDMLQHAGHEHRVAIGHRVYVNLDGVTQITVDQHRRTAGNHHGFANIGFKLRKRVDDFHGAAAQHIGRAHEHRITDGLRHAHGFFCRTRDAVVRLF